MAFAPIITRIYGPEAYGIQGVFITIVTIMSTVAALSYPIAIVLPRHDIEAIGLSKLSIVIGLVLSLISALILYIAGENMLSSLHATEIVEFMYLLPLAMFFAVVGSVIAQWLIRKKEFALTSKVGVLMSLLTSCSKAGVGALYPSALALILINTLSGVVSSAILYFGWMDSRFRKRRRLNSGGFDSEIAWGLVRKYADFAVIRTPQSLINVISQSVPVLFLSVYFGAETVGFYSIAVTVLSMPSAIIGGSVMQVFFPRFNEAVRDGEDILLLLLKATVAMAVVGFLPFFTFLVFGGSLFAIAFGQKWLAAGTYAQWLSVGLYFVFINRPCLGALSVMRKQGALLLSEIFGLALKVGALYAGFSFFGEGIASIAIFSLANAGLNILLAMYVIVTVRRRSFECEAG